MTAIVARTDFKTQCQEFCGMDGCGNRYCSANPRYYYRKKRAKRRGYIPRQQRVHRNEPNDRRIDR